MRRTGFALVLSAFTFLLAAPAAAQTQPGATYTEQKVDSGQAVIFHDDALRAGGLETRGYVIQVPASGARRSSAPRLNFVAEMLKCAESP
jgi:hypothetical protein